MHEVLVIMNYTCILCVLFSFNTIGSATMKSTAHPSCVVSVLYDVSWEKIC